MAENFSCWAETWVMRRRGGHYEFKLPAMGTSFEQQVSDALKELLTPLTHEYGGKAEYYADVIAPRVAAAIEAMGQTWPEGDNNDGALPLSHEQRQAAALAALAGDAGGGEQK
jgi:hypothetical protein